MSYSKTFDLYLTSSSKKNDPSSSIEYLAQGYGEDIFQKLLNSLLNLNLSVQEATKLWKAAMKHFSPESNRMNWRSVVLDYLLSCTDQLSNPRIIEAEELRRLERNAITDGLTNLYNQSYFKQQLANTARDYAKSPEAVFSLLFLELDYFKQLNDRCGHLCGDRVLEKVAQIICTLLPEDCLAARYAGEEFAVLLPDTDMLQAINLAEEIRSTVEKTVFDGEERLDNGTLTISGGIASYPIAGTSSSALIAEANSKRYQAKLACNKILPAEKDTRDLTRHAINNIVEIVDNNNGGFKNALSANLSQTGILLKSSTPAAIGSSLKLHFPYPFWPTEHSTSGYVRHVRKSGRRGGFLLGIEFTQPQTSFVDEILPADTCASES